MQFNARPSRYVLASVAAVLATASTAVVVTTQVVAAEQASVARIVSVDELTPTRSAVFIDSPAMHRTMRIEVLHPAHHGPRPTYYLLDGVDSGPLESNWTQKTDIVSFFADKDVNVVLPVAGKGSFYTDWRKADPVLGRTLEWETFLTTELPGLVDRHLDGNGHNAIGGLSMGAEAAASLATRHPQLYQGLSIFSGCLDTLSPDARSAVRESVTWEGGNPDNMWGPDSDPAWAEHDPMSNAAALRGKTIYVAVGNGAPGPESFGDPQMPSAVTFGAILEYATRNCTAKFQRRLAALDIPATFVYRPHGTHSWPYWEADLHDSWPTMATALAAPVPGTGTAGSMQAGPHAAPAPRATQAPVVPIVPSLPALPHPAVRPDPRSAAESHLHHIPR